VALVPKAADGIRIAFFKTFGVKKINVELLLTMRNNFVGQM
jgi:hypothetical protein